MLEGAAVTHYLPFVQQIRIINHNVFGEAAKWAKELKWDDVRHKHGALRKKERNHVCAVNISFV